MAPRPFRVRVTTMELELNFVMEPDTTGKQLFDQVARNIGLREIWYFGLEYTDYKRIPSWLEPGKKILAQVGNKNPSEALQFRFLVRFYPEDVSEELIEEVTQNLFYRQVKHNILNDLIYCPPETCVLLASYAMQIKYGDYDESKYPPGRFVNERFLPQRVIDQFRLSNHEWEKRVVNWWKEHQELPKPEAMMEYLKIAQDLDMYGVTYFEIRNKRGTLLLLGVDALGISIYDTQDKLTPQIGFPWNEIRNVSFKSKQFIIKPVDRQSPDFVFTVSKIRVNRQILSLCIGNHMMYVRRRSEESPEVEQLKTRAAERKLERMAEKDRMKTESKRRQEVEQDRESLRQKITDLQTSTQLIREAIEEQARQAREHEIKRRQAEEDQLYQKQEQEKTDREHQKDMERIRFEQQERERRRLLRLNNPVEYWVEEIEKTFLLAEENIHEVQRKEAEARQIEEDLRETIIRALQLQQEYDASYAQPSSEYNVPTDDNASDDDISASCRPPPMETTPPKENDRTPVLKRDETKQRKLEEERQDLQEQKKGDTPEDKIYRENTVGKGIDKYKTLKKIRQGTVKRRIDEFESM